jgi:outer membrane lipase/esterase
MRTFRPTLAASAVALLVGALAAPGASAQFSNAYIFGDSLSDAGQYGARFTTNPGLTYPMYLAQRYGLTASPSFTGGNDYGQGGARVNSPSLDIPANAPNISIAQQVTAFLAKGPADPNALYQLQGGGNDILQLADLLGNGQITQAQFQGAVGQAAVDLATQAARLQAAGARYIVVYSLPDIGLTPAAAAAGQRAQFTAVGNLFNSTLNAALTAANVQVIQVNQAQLLREIAANPSSFGFTNVTLPVCTTSSSLSCTPATLRDPNGNLTWAFADGIHPTTGLATIGAQQAASMIEAPAKIGALGEAPINVEQATFRTIDARMIGAVGSPRVTNKFDAWVSYDYGTRDLSGSFLSGDDKLNTIAVGGDIKVNANLLVGVAFNYTEDKGDFGGGTGGYKLRETSMTAYAGYEINRFWVAGTLGAGNLDYKDVHRNIQLGALDRRESGSTNGSHITYSALGGYWFAYKTLLHGPWARVAWQDISVHGFSESGSDSTALSFGEQKRKSLISSLGWHVTGQLGAVRPYARVTWEHESKDDDRTVSATPVGLSTTYAMPVIKPDNSYANFVLGLASDFGRVTGYVSAQGTSGRNDGNGYGITLGVLVPL